MAQEKVQNFENHSRVVPPYHMFVIPVFMINFVWRLVQLRYGITFASIMNVLLAAAFVILVSLCARLFAYGSGPRDSPGDALAAGARVVSGPASHELRNSRFRSWFRCASRPIKNCLCLRSKCWMKS